MTYTTDRFALPLLAVAQAQKEITHNEALVLLDAIVQPVVVAVAPSTIPASPIAGQGWIVGGTPSGAWTGQANKLAVWTAGGWRFVMPIDGMTVWSLAESMPYRRQGASWVAGALRGKTLTLDGAQVVGARQSAIGGPAGGTVIDAESRASIAAILVALRTHGLIAT